MTARKKSGVHQNPDSPTSRMMQAMDGAYRYFSEALFAPVLGATPPPPMVSLSRGKTQRVLGFFVPEYWSDGTEAFGWIAITPEAILRSNPRDAMATLVHEMAHALDHAQTIAKGRKPSGGGYHPKSWFAIMDRIGLPGVAHTPAKIAVGHAVVDGGPFDVAFRAMPPELLLPFAALGTTHAPKKKPTKQGKRYKYECPSCGTTLRGPSGKSILCVECGVLFVEEGAEADAVAA